MDIGELSLYQEIAIYVHELLQCDYAFVAVPDHNSVRIQAMAGPERRRSDYVPADLFSRLGGWGPVVLDDSRVIAVPVLLGNRTLAILVGYSSNPGTFTTSDLEKLVIYSNAVSAMLAHVPAERAPAAATSFTPAELRRFSRLITIGQLSNYFVQELMNPLTLVRGHLQLLQESVAVDESLQINIDVIERAARRIEEMAKRMLDFGKKRAARMETCHVSDLMSDALKFIQTYVRHPFVDVQLALDSQLPLVRVDRWQMVHAIVNILHNAIDAMANSERRTLTITARAVDDQMHIAISDTGMGIASSDISKVFQPFFSTKADRGAGLGLYVAKDVIEEHGGTVHLQTNDRGTTFRIDLPISLPN
jgi:signal transduction histidine kinase